MILAISDFVTVFEIARGSNGVFADACFRMLVGISALIGGVTALVFKRKNNGLKSWIAAVFAIVWSLLWLYLHNFPHIFGLINNLVRAYQEGQYQIVEGQVQVLHQQPVTGHTKGDIITVNGKQFEMPTSNRKRASAKTPLLPLAISNTVAKSDIARIIAATPGGWK